MKQIITAIGEEKLNHCLEKLEGILVKSPDIQYQEGIMEAFEQYPDIDSIVLREDIIGELSIQELIQKVIMIKQKIEIIVITNQKETLMHIQNIKLMVDNNQDYVENVLSYFLEQIPKKNQKIPEKSEIQKMNERIEKNKPKKRYQRRKEEKKKEIVTVIGSAGSGKTMFVSIIARLLDKRKILIIDFDMINHQIHSIFGVKELTRQTHKRIEEQEEFVLKEQNFKELVVRISKNIDLISKTKLFFQNDSFLREKEWKQVLEELQKKYDLILIDTSSDTKYQELTNRLVAISNQVFCLMQGNLIYLKNTIKRLKAYEEYRKKIKLIYNQKDEYTLPCYIMKVIFYRYKIAGSIYYHQKYNQIVNHNIKRRYFSKEICKEYQAIIQNCKL